MAISFRYNFSPVSIDTTSMFLSSCGVLASCSLLIRVEIPPELVLPDGKSILDAETRVEISSIDSFNSLRLLAGTSIHISGSLSPSNSTFARPIFTKSSRICLAKYFSVFSENGPDISMRQTSSFWTISEIISFSISWGNVVILATADCTSDNADDMDASSAKWIDMIPLPSYAVESTLST